MLTLGQTFDCINCIDFKPIITRISEILPLSVVTTADKSYDSEDNHRLVREILQVFSVIPAHNEHVPIWRTHGKYRKQMKCSYSKGLCKLKGITVICCLNFTEPSKVLYNQRNKDEP
jgi:hypothetical protein